MSTHEIIFQFWLDYFSDAIEEKVDECDRIRFPVCRNIMLRYRYNIYKCLKDKLYEYNYHNSAKIALMK